MSFEPKDNGGKLTRVLYVQFDVIPSAKGASARATELLRGLTPFYQIDALTVREEELSYVERYYGARLLRVSIFETDVVKRISAFRRALKRQLESEEYDIVHFLDPFGGAYICQEKSFLNYSLIYEADYFPSIEFPQLYPSIVRSEKLISRWAEEERMCLENADVVLTSSQVTRKLILSMGVSTDKIVLLSGCVDVEEFQIEETPKHHTNVVELIYTGSFASWQGLETLLLALKKCKSFSSLRLRLVCPNDAVGRKNIKKKANELGISSMLYFQGPVEHEYMAKHIATADIGVAPLEKCERNIRQGGCPAKILEYMACGKPVISSRLPMIEEILKDGTEGILVEPGSPEELADAIEELAGNPELCKKMGNAGRKKIRQLYNADQVRKRLLGIYHGMAGKKVLISPQVWVEAEIPAYAPAALKKGTSTPPEKIAPPPLKPKRKAGEATARIARKQVSKKEHSTTQIVARKKGRKKQTPTEKLPAASPERGTPNRKTKSKK